jgi:hypothetical protein
MQRRGYRFECTLFPGYMGSPGRRIGLLSTQINRTGPHVKIKALLMAALTFVSLSALAEAATVHQCKTAVQARIDKVDAEMHMGTRPNDGRKLVEHRDRLRAQLNQCATNPKIYLKNLDH